MKQNHMMIQYLWNSLRLFNVILYLYVHRKQTLLFTVYGTGVEKSIATFFLYITTLLGL